jgi:hypothetical protein
VLNTIVQEIQNISGYNFDKVEQCSARRKGKQSYLILGFFVVIFRVKKRTKFSI